MSSEIDNRVVSLTFDNKDFEQEIKRTAESLQAFDEGLNTLGAGSALEGLDALADRFTTLKTIGILALADLTAEAVKFGASMVKNVVSQISSGGKARFLKLEQARFMLSGMGQDVDGVMRDALAAVEGTSYGLDSAAGAASRFAAAGIKSGKQLEDALRGVAGVAAVTGGSFDDIGDIFSEAAALGNVTGNTLMRFNARNFNVASILAKEFNVSTEEVQKMVKKKQITFEQFAEIMSRTFGDKAKSANETYTGALANVGSALSRIGAVFQGFKLESMRQMFNSIIPVINSFKKALEPIMFIYALMTQFAAKRVKTLVSGLIGEEGDQKTVLHFIANLREFFLNITGALAVIARSAITLGEALTGAFQNVFKGNLLEFLINTSVTIKSFAERMELSADRAAEFGKIFGAVLSVFRLAGSIVGGLLSVISDVGSGLSGASGGILSFIARMSDFVTFFIWAAIETGTVRSIFESLGKVLSFVVNALLKVVGAIGLGAWFVFTNLLKLIHSGFTLLMIPIAAVTKAIGSVFAKGGPAAEAFHAAVNQIKDSFKALAPASSAASAAMTSLKGIFGSIAKWLVDKLPSQETFVKAFGGIGNFFSGLIESIGKVIPSIDEVKLAFGSVGGFFDLLITKSLSIGGIFGTIVGGFVTVLGTLANALFSTTIPLDAIGGTFDNVGGGLGKFQSFIEGLVKVFRRLIDAVTGSLGWFGEQISQFLSFDTVSGVAKGLDKNFTKILIGGFGVILYNIVRFMREVHDVFSLGDISENVIGLLDGMTGALKTMQKGIIAEAIKDIAVAIGILALSLIALSFIDPAKAKSGINNILVLMGGIMGLMTTMSLATKSFSGVNTTFASIGAGMVGVAGAILILTGAVALLGTMKQETLDRGISSVMKLMGMFGALIVVTNLAGGAEGFLSLGAGLLLLAVALSVLIIPIKALGEMDWDTLKQGLISVGLLLAGLTAMMAIVNKTGGPGGILSMGAGMLALAIALNLLVIPIKILGSMDTGTLVVGMLALGVLLAGITAMVIAITTLGGPGGMLQAGVGMIAIAGAVILLAVALDMLSDNSIAGTIVSVLALIVILEALIFAAQALQAVALGVAGLLGVAGAIVLIAYAMDLLSNNSIAGTIVNTLSLIALIAVLAIAATALQASGAGVIALVALATAVLMIANALAILAKLDIGDIIKALIALVGTILIMAVIAVVLGAIGPVALIAAAGLMALAAAALVFSVAALVMAVAFKIIAQAVNEGGDSLISIITELALLIPTILTGIALGLVDMAKTFLDAMPELIDSVTEVITKLIDAGITLVPKFIELGAVFVNGLLDGFNSVRDNLITTAVDLIVAVMTAMRDNAYLMGTLGSEIITNLLNGISDRVEDLTNSAVDLIVKFANALSARTGDLVDAATTLFHSFMSALTENVDQIATDITNFIIRLIGAISDNSWLIIDAGTAALVKFLEGMAKTTDTVLAAVRVFIRSLLKSISDTMVGITSDFINIVVGFLNGMAEAIRQGSTRVNAAAGNLAKAVVGGLVQGLGAAKNELLEAGKSMAKMVISGATGTNGFDVNSPSKVFYGIGLSVIEGLTKALYSDTSSAKASSDLASGTVSAFQRSIANINYAVSTMTEFNPTIVPLLDLSLVTDEAKKMSSIFGGQTFAASVSASNAAGISEATSSRTDTTPQQQEQTTKEITFTQVITSTEPLSTADIYNATRSQIRMATEELNLL